MIESLCLKSVNYEGLYKLQLYMHFEGEACFIKKTFQIYVESATFMNQGELCFLSMNSGIQHHFKGKTTVDVKKMFQVSAIDIIYQMEQNSDNEVTLQIIFGEGVVGKVTFDLSKQKLKSVQSKTIFKREFNNLTGFICYKFLSCSTSIIRKEDFETNLCVKGKIVEQIVKNYSSMIKDRQRWQQIITDKQRNNRELQEKISQVESENASLKQKMQKQWSEIKRGMKINTSMATFSELKNAEKKIEAYQSTVKTMKRKIVNLQQEIQDLYERINDMIKNGLSYDKKTKLIDELPLKRSQSLPRQDQKSLFKQFQNNFIIEVKSQKQQRKISTKQINSQSYQNQKLCSQDNLITQQNSCEKQPKLMHQLIPKTPSFLNAKDQAYLHQQHLNLQGNIYDQSDCKSNNEKQNFLLPEGQTKRKSKKQRADHLQYDIISLKIKLDAKEKEIQILTEQLKKKDLIVEKVKQKQVDFHKNLKFLQNQKARLLSNLANNTSGTTDNINTLTALKELGSYNKELLKQKDAYLKEIEELKDKIEKKQDKINKYDEQLKSYQVKMGELIEQKQLWEMRQNDLKLSMSKLSSLHESSMSDSRVMRIKNQMMSYEMQVRKMREERKREHEQKQLFEEALKSKNQMLARQTDNSKKQLQTISKKNQVMEYEKKIMKAQLTKMSEQYKQSMNMNKRYFEIQKKFETTRKTAIKVENQLNRRIKKDDLDMFKGEMQKIIGILFVSINDFEVEFYNTLQKSFKISSVILGKYFQSLIQIETEKYEGKNNQIHKQLLNDSKSLKRELTPQQAKEFRAKKEMFQRQKSQKQKLIEEQIKMLNEKKEKRLLMLDKQIGSFQQGVQVVENQIRELMAYKQILTNFFQNEASQYLNLPANSLKSQIQLKNIVVSETKRAKSSIKERNVQNAKRAKQGQSMIQPSKGSSHCLPDISDIAIKELKDQQCDKFEEQQFSNKKESSINADNSILDGKSSLKKTIVYKKSGIQEGVEAFSRLGTSLAIKTSMLKDFANSRDSKMYGTFMGKAGGAGSVTVNQALSISRQLIEERSRMREMKLKSIQQNAKLNNNLFHEKLNKDILVVRHEQREKELQYQFQKAKSKHNQQIKQYLKKIASLEQTVNSTNIVIRQKQELVERVKQLTNELMQAGELLELLEAEKEDLRSACYDLEGRIGIHMDGKIALTAQIQQINQRYQEKEKSLHLLIRQKAILIETVQQTKDREIQKLQRKLQRIQQDVQAEMMNAVNAKKQQSVRVAECEQTIESLRVEYEQLKESIKILSEEYRQIEEQRSFLWQQNEKLRSSISMLVEKNEESQMQLLKTSRMIDSYQEEKVVLSKIEKQLQQKIEKMRKQFEQISEKQSSQIKKWEINYSNLEFETRLLNQEEKKIKQQLNKAKIEVEKYQGKVTEKQREILTLQKQISVKVLDISRLKEQFQTVTKKSKQDEERIFDLEVEKERLEDQLIQTNGNRSSKVELSRTQNRVKGIVHLNSGDKSNHNQPISARASIRRSPSLHQFQPPAKTKQQFDFTTPLVEFMAENQEFQEFSEHSVAQLIEEIRTLRVKAERLEANLKAEQEENNRLVQNLKQRVAEAYKLMEDMKRLQKSEKDLRMEIVKHEAREKKYEKELKEKKQALSEQQRQGNSEVKEMVKFSQLASQLQLENQKLRWEISQGVLSEEQRQSYAKGIKAFETVLKEGKSFFGSENNPLSAEVVTLKKELASVREQLAEKCDALQELEKRNTSEAGVKYKQKYDKLTKEMLSVAAAYRKLQGQNVTLKTSLKDFNKQINNRTRTSHNMSSIYK